MDDAGDVVLLHHALEVGEVGDVAVDARERLELLVAQREPQAVVAAPEVIGDDGLAAVEQRANGPGAEGAEGAGYEVAHARHDANGARSAERRAAGARGCGAMSDPVSIPPLPAPLAWGVEPASFSLDDGPLLTIAAPPRTDLFVDPAGAEPRTARPGCSARGGRLPALGARAVHVRRHLRRRRAAAVGGRAHVGEARLRGVAAGRDDGRLGDHGRADVRRRQRVRGRGRGRVAAALAPRGGVRAARAGRGRRGWRFVRHFALDALAACSVGFSAQSPTGRGRDGALRRHQLRPEAVADLRSGE